MSNTIAHPPYGLAMEMGFAGFRAKGKNKWRRADTRIFVRFYFNVTGHVFLKHLLWKEEKA